jgi:thioesterase domain-containing protein
LATLFQQPTIEHLAAALDGETVSTPQTPLVPIQPRGSRKPFFIIHPAGGVVFPYFSLAFLIGSDQPFYAIQDPSLFQEREPHERIEDMASEYIKIIREAQPEGPYRLGGWSMGGLVAYEMAQQLHQAGQEVSLLALIAASPWMSRVRAVSSRKDSLRVFKTNVSLFIGVVRSALPYFRDGFYLLAATGKDLRERLSRRLPILDYFRRLWAGAAWEYYLKKAEMAKLASRHARILLFRQPSLRRCLYVLGCHTKSTGAYEGRPYPGRITLFRQPILGPDPTLGWGDLAEQGVEVHEISGSHITMLQRPHVEALAAELRACLDRDEEE